MAKAIQAKSEQAQAAPTWTDRQDRRKQERVAAKAQKRDARQQMIAKLAVSCLDAKDADALGFESFTNAESVALPISRSGAGFKIAYFSVTGELLPMFRYRYYDLQGPFGILQRKYDQPIGTAPEIYFPHIGGAIWAEIVADASKPLVITEGELKAACLTKQGVPTIGIGGVFNFGSKRLGVELLPALDQVEWKGRDVYVIYDSDIQTNENIMRAANRLARLLTERGALVRIVEIPAEDGK